MFLRRIKDLKLEVPPGLLSPKTQAMIKTALGYV